MLSTGATVAHRSPTLRLGPDALRLPNSRLKKRPKSQGAITKKGSKNQPDQKVDNLAVLPGGIWGGHKWGSLGGHQGENKELRKANEILKLASAFFAQAELDRRLKS